MMLKLDSPEIQKVAAAAKENRDKWVRVYQIHCHEERR